MATIIALCHGKKIPKEVLAGIVDEVDGLNKRRAKRNPITYCPYVKSEYCTNKYRGSREECANGDFRACGSYKLIM